MRPRRERESSEINGMAFGMPTSFPERNEGELFPARCALNLPPFLFAAFRLLPLARLGCSRAYADCSINENDRKCRIDAA